MSGLIKRLLLITSISVLPLLTSSAGLMALELESGRYSGQASLFRGLDSVNEQDGFTLNDPASLVSLSTIELPEPGMLALLGLGLLGLGLVSRRKKKNNEQKEKEHP